MWQPRFTRGVTVTTRGERNSDRAVGRAQGLTTDPLKDTHGEPRTVIHDQLINTRLAAPGFNSDDLDAGFTERGDHACNPAMPVGHGHHDPALPGVDRQHGYPQLSGAENSGPSVGGAQAQLACPGIRNIYSNSESDE